jgi:hypothetical protein
MCRKAHGGAFATYLEVGQSRPEFSTGSELVVSFQSSADAMRSFCSRCGATLFFREVNEACLWVAAGVLDTDPGIRPQAHMFVASKAGWFEIADDLPQYPAFPPSPAA